MPFPPLTKCEGEPTYPEMTVIWKEIYQNLASINSPFDQRQAGFLGIVMPQAPYIQRFDKTFYPPEDPGNYSSNVPANETAEGIKTNV